MVISNHSHTSFYIRSEYPVSVAGGRCSAQSIVDEHLECDASNLSVTDMRPSLLIWAKANSVTVTSPLMDSFWPTNSKTESHELHPQVEVSTPAKPIPSVPVYGRGIDPPETEEQPNATAENSRSPETKSVTVSFMPGQAVNLPNRTFRKVIIRSEYPLRVLTGPCHMNYTVEFFCSSTPGDLFIADTRRWPIFVTPHANSVTITLEEF
jgi:hypothetical protein